MKILFVGSSSLIAQLIEKKLGHNIYCISRSKSQKKNAVYTKNYNQDIFLKSLTIFKKKKIKFDVVVFFNGYHKSTIISYFNKKLFNKIININLITPLELTSLMIKNDFLNLGCSVVFIGSIAAELNEIGNAYYSMAKCLLEKSINLLSREQKKNYRFNVLSLGLVKNKTSENLIKNLPSNYKNKNKFVNEKLLIKKFKYLFENRKIKNKVIKLHGGYIR